MKIYDYNGKKNISGTRIKEARIKAKLSQSDLAAKMQINGIIIERDCISRIEIGTRFVPDYELPIYAKILNVSVEWLLGLIWLYPKWKRTVIRRFFSILRGLRREFLFRETIPKRVRLPFRYKLILQYKFFISIYFLWTFF